MTNQTGSQPDSMRRTHKKTCTERRDSHLRLFSSRRQPPLLVNDIKYDSDLDKKMEVKYIFVSRASPCLLKIPVIPLKYQFEIHKYQISIFSSFRSSPWCHFLLLIFLLVVFVVLLPPARHVRRFWSDSRRPRRQFVFIQNISSQSNIRNSDERRRRSHQLAYFIQ